MEKDPQSVESENAKGSSGVTTAAFAVAATSRSSKKAVKSLSNQVSEVGHAAARIPSSESRARIEEVFDFWKECMGYKRARLDDKRRKLIRQRFADGYSVEDLKLAVFGCRHSRFHQGENDRRHVYDGIELILRDAGHVDKFAANGERVVRRMAEERSEQINRAQSAQTRSRAIPPAVREIMMKCGMRSQR